MVEMKEQLDVTDVKGNKIGVMNVEIAPCNDKGREYTEADDMFVDSPEDLVKKNVNFVFKILNCRGLPNKYTVTKLITYCFHKRSDKLGIHKTHCFLSGCSLQIQDLFGREGPRYSENFTYSQSGF